MRRLVVAAIAASALALAPANVAAADPVVTYACSPPLPQDAANCSIWHTGPVTLYWGWLASYTPLVPANCAQRTFSSDTAGAVAQCVVSKGDGSPPEYATATIRIDATAPAVTAMSALRPPDHDGWWNHPVAFAFGGTDATSGIASCDTVNYSGPGGDAAKVTGGCTDVAGNTASGSFPIKYDATAPTVTAGSSSADVGQVSISWMTSADAVSSSVLRSPGIGGAPISEVYSGPNRSFTDSGVTGGETYTYTINASDPAGNTASATMSVKAKAAPQAGPARKLVAPLLDWPSVKGADYYNVQLFRNGRKVLSTWPRHSRLQLLKSWRYAGKRRSLSAGTYRWYAWPGFGRRAARRYGKLIVTRRFKVKAARAAPVSGQAASRG